MADAISPVWAIPTMGPWGGSIAISALCRRFSTASVTLVSNPSPRILRILLRPVSTSLRMLGVITYFLAVYSTFIKHLNFQGFRASKFQVSTWQRLGSPCHLETLKPVTFSLFSDVCWESSYLHDI